MTWYGFEKAGRTFPLGAGERISTVIRSVARSSESLRTVIVKPLAGGTSGMFLKRDVVSPVDVATQMRRGRGIAPQDAGVGSAAVNTMQQIGGAVGTALLNTLAASAATSYLHGRQPTPAAQAQLHSYATAYWWSVGLFLAGAIVALLLYRKAGAATQDTPSPRRRRGRREAYALIREALADSGDIQPSPGQLLIRLDPLTAPRRTHALASLCEQLNPAQARFPGTDLVLRYEVKPHPGTA